LGTTLDESARRAGHHLWAEARLFEALGGWVTSTADPDLKLMLDRHSKHCAWRAAQWEERLPVLADVDRGALRRPPSEAVARAVDRLAGLDSPVARLAGAYRVALPRLWAAYDRHRRAAGEVADGSTLRALAIVSADLGNDWREGELALQDLLADAAAVAEAARAVADLEELLAGTA
jgi:hypothetical protein